MGKCILVITHSFAVLAQLGRRAIRRYVSLTGKAFGLIDPRVGRLRKAFGAQPWANLGFAFSEEDGRLGEPSLPRPSLPPGVATLLFRRVGKGSVLCAGTGRGARDLRDERDSL